MDAIKKALEGLGPWGQSACAGCCWLVGNINILTGFIAFFVVAYQLKTSYFKSKMEKLKYDKMAKEYQTAKNRRKQ